MAHFHTSSPMVVIPPQPVPGHYFSGSCYRPVQPSQYAPASNHSNGMFNQPPTPESLPPTPSAGCIAGRKRTRGDDYAPEDDTEDAFSSSPIESSPLSQGEPIYGPGMTLLYPNDPKGHYVSDATSQSSQTTDSIAQARRPLMPSRKSQRTAATAEDASILKRPELSGRSGAPEPLIDSTTRLLGISWTRMDSTESRAISSKAYTRWIERHYPALTNVELWFENSSLNAYLGCADNLSTRTKDFLLWSDDLKQAVLVTRDPTELIVKLGSPSTLLRSATMSMFAVTDVATDNSVSATTSAPAVSQGLPITTGEMEVD